MIPCAVGTVPANAALLTVFGPIGAVSFNFLNVITPGGRSNGVEPGQTCTVGIWESNDKKVFTQIGTNYTIKPGGEESVKILTRKKFIMIRGSAPKSGIVRLDIFQRGVPFKGQISIDIFGKRGLSKDYLAPSTFTAAGGATNSNTSVTMTALPAGSLYVGQLISGAGIPVGTSIVATNGTSSATLSQAATATATGLTFTLGTPNTSPAFLAEPASPSWPE